MTRDKTSLPTPAAVVVSRVTVLAHVLFGGASLFAALHVALRLAETSLLGLDPAQWQNSLVGLAPPCAMMAALIWLGLLLLRRSRELTERQEVLKSVSDIDISGKAKLDLIFRFGQSNWPTSQNRALIDADDARVMAAGRWVITQFDAGRTVFALVSEADDLEKLRQVSGPAAGGLHVLHARGRGEEDE